MTDLCAVIDRPRSFSESDTTAYELPGFRASPPPAAPPEPAQVSVRALGGYLGSGAVILKDGTLDHAYGRVYGRQIQRTVLPLVVIAVNYDDLLERSLSAGFANATAGSSPSLLQQARRSPVRCLGESPAERRVQRLTEIQTAFGFSMQALAQILDISRPGLYKWMDPSRQVALQKASITRISAIEQLAQYWSSLTNAPLTLALNQNPQYEASVLAMMSETPINQTRVRQEFARVAASLTERPKTRSEKMRAAGFLSRKPAAIPRDE